MDNNEQLYATHKGMVKIGDYTIPCAVLNNGKECLFKERLWVY